MYSDIGIAKPGEIVCDTAIKDRDRNHNYTLIGLLILLYIKQGFEL